MLLENSSSGGGVLVFLVNVSVNTLVIIHENQRRSNGSSCREMIRTDASAIPASALIRTGKNNTKKILIILMSQWRFNHRNSLAKAAIKIQLCNELATLLIRYDWIGSAAFVQHPATVNLPRDSMAAS